MYGAVWEFRSTHFFSPNSKQRPTIPHEDASHYMSPSHIDPSDMQKPIWWSPRTEWMAYVPILPVPYHGVLFDSLGQLPIHYSRNAASEYVVPGALLAEWEELEDLVVTFVDKLSEEAGIPYTRPFKPLIYLKGHFKTESDCFEAVRRCRDWFSVWVGLLYWLICRVPNSHHFKKGWEPPSWYLHLAMNCRKQSVLDALRTSCFLQRDLYILRVGVFLHHPDTRLAQPAASYFVQDAVPIWYKWGRHEKWTLQRDDRLISPQGEHWKEMKVLKHQQSRSPSPPPQASYSTSQSTSSAYQNPPSASHHEPQQTNSYDTYDYTSNNMDTFEPNNVISSSKFPSWSGVQPSSDTSLEPQLMSTAWTSSAETASPSHREGRDFWEKWLKVWVGSYEKRLGNETAGERNTRLQRWKIPPTKKTSVFEWLWNDEHTTLTRTSVKAESRFLTLCQYRAMNKIYNPYSNEWDCCEDWDEWKSDNVCDDDNNDDEEDVMHHDVKNSLSWAKSILRRGDKQANTDVSMAREKKGKQRVTSTPAVLSVIHLAHPLPHLAQSSSGHPQTNVRETSSAPNVGEKTGNNGENPSVDAIVRILQLHFGFIPSYPIQHHVIPEADCIVFARAIGMANQLKPTAKFFTLPIANECVNFLCCFYSRQLTSKPPDNLWDISSKNSEGWNYSWGGSCVQVVTTRRGNQMYMFIDPHNATVPWYIGVYTASAALLVCRLGEKMTDKEIVMELVKMGVAFRTLQDKTTLTSTQDDMPLLQQPSCLYGHNISHEEYVLYRHTRESILVAKRGRAALLKGGFSWRIAQDHMTLSRACDGPSGVYDKPELMFSVVDENGVVYVDDELCDLEFALVAGLYIANTGIRSQTRKVSWFPLPSYFDKPACGENVGWWSSGNEDVYQKCMTCITTGDRLVMSLPMSSPAWTGWMRGFSESRNARSQGEKWSEEFIKSII